MTETSKNYDRDRLYPVWQPENPELADAMFEAATREQILGYDFCREKGIGQQAVWDAFHKEKDNE